jgi:hypothetical protein
MQQSFQNENKINNANGCEISMDDVMEEKEEENDLKTMIVYKQKQV